MKTKVLFVIESLAGGGAEKVLSTLLKHIDQRKFDVSLCTIVDTGKYVDEIKTFVQYCPIMQSPEQTTVFGWLKYTLMYKLVYNWLPLWLVYKLFIPKGYDVEVAFCEGFATKLMSHSSNKKARKIAWVHIDLKNYPWPQKAGVYRDAEEERSAYSAFDKVVTVSRTAQGAFVQLYGMEDKVTTLYNPIDSEDIKSKAALTSVARTSAVQLVTVGRLNPQKNYSMLLRVAKRLRDEGFAFHINIVGDGEQRGILEQYIAEHNLSEVVTLCGFHSNPYPFIANADLMVVSSLSEGYSTAVTESLILGVPVLTTDCSGMKELLQGDCGVITENSEEAFYEGLKRLLLQPELIDEYKRGAQERSKDFSLKELVEAIERELLNVE